MLQSVRHAWRLVWLVGICLLAQAAVAQDETERAYRLGPGDSVNIRVFDEADLSGNFLLDENGAFFYAFVGRIALAGETLAGAEQKLFTALKGDYLVNPQVSVTVAQYRPFFIKGAVRSPGSYTFQPGLTVAKAISLAGGLTERASDRKIFLVPNGGIEADRRRVGLDDALGPGDTITVEESFF
jgi:polysaccharide export outer membrane protein